MFPLAEAIWHGAIGILAAGAEAYQGAGLASHLRAAVRLRYPALNAAQMRSLASYTFDAISVARQYVNGANTYTPLVREISDPRRVLQYAADAGAIDLTGMQREIRYTFEYFTEVTDQRTGESILRNNVFVLRSRDPLSRQELYGQAQQQLLAQIVFNSGSDPTKTYQLHDFDVRSVNLSFG